uniref:COPA/B TPR domain-containing protein n=1 Tax=Zea mays TaxID=4577 RepID=A0A804QQX2_MAIZE
MAAAAADFRSRRSCGRHVHLYPLHLCPLVRSWLRISFPSISLVLPGPLLYMGHRVCDALELNGVHSLCPAVWSKYRRWSMLEMAEECLLQAKDLSGLLLLYSSLGDAEGIEKLASLAKEHGKNNVAFLCLFMLGKVEDCIQLLVDSKVLEIVAIWRDDLSKINPKAAESLADPSEYPNLFEDWQVALTVEKSVASQSMNHQKCWQMNAGAPCVQLPCSMGFMPSFFCCFRSTCRGITSKMKLPPFHVEAHTLSIRNTTCIRYCERCTYWLTAMTDPILFERGGLPTPGWILGFGGSTVSLFAQVEIMMSCLEIHSALLSIDYGAVISSNRSTLCRVQ